MNVEWIFFDLDGTLLDHESAADAAVDHLGGSYASVLGELGQSELRVRWRELQTKWFEEYLAGRCTFRQQRAQRVRELWGSVGAEPPDVDQVHAIFETYLQAYETAWVLYDDVVPCMDRLDGRPLGVITNGDRDQQLRKLKACGLGGRFEQVITSSEVGKSKPVPAVFHAALAAADAEPSACSYIGDRLDTDAIAAAAVGMRGIWLDRGADDRPTRNIPWHVSRITSLHEFTP